MAAKTLRVAIVSNQNFPGEPARNLEDHLKWIAKAHAQGAHLIAPFDNNDVRLALKYAIDREQLAKIILRGYGSVGNDHPIASMNRYHADELPQRKYDLDKAKTI